MTKSEAQHLFGPLGIFIFSFLLFYLMSPFSSNADFWLSVAVSLICVFVFEIGQIDGYRWASNQSHWFIFKLFYKDFLCDIGLGIAGGFIIPFILKFTIAFVISILYI